MSDPQRLYVPQAAELLRTKLMPPRPRATLVARTALVARLDAGFERADAAAGTGWLWKDHAGERMACEIEH